MAPFTVQQRFGLKPEELNALTVLSGLEGYRGPNSVDPAAVAASTLQRRLSGKWGGRDIRNIATAPGQFAAVLDRGINMQQLGDPAYGAKLLGGQSEFNRIQSMINDPSIVAGQMGKVGESFRALSQGPKSSDYIPVPGKSNFYFNRNPAISKQGISLLQGANTAQAPGAPPPLPGVGATLADALGQGIAQQPQEPKTMAQKLVDQFKSGIIQNIFPQGILGTLMAPSMLGGM
jgi:hypothetical protein